MQLNQLIVIKTLQTQKDIKIIIQNIANLISKCV